MLPLEGMVRASRSVWWRKNLYRENANVTDTIAGELHTALAEVSSTMHTITTEKGDGSATVGPTLTSEVQLKGCPVRALLDTGLRTTIVSLELPLKTLAKQKRPDETPADWRDRVK